MNNNTILAIVFLMAGTLLTTTAVTMVPAAYAGDGKGNHNKIKLENSAEDESTAEATVTIGTTSQSAVNDCGNSQPTDVDCTNELSQEEDD